MWTYNYSNELYHYGVKGMRWGVRRYQNENGTLTAKGRSKYGVKDVNEYAHLKELRYASNADRILQMRKSRKTWNKERNKTGNQKIDDGHSTTKSSKIANKNNKNPSVEEMVADVGKQLRQLGLLIDPSTPEGKAGAAEIYKVLGLDWPYD